MSTNTLVLGLFEYDPTTDANLPFSITDALNNNWDKIDSLVPLLSTIAAPFNPEQSYAVGAYCTYQGNLQRCNTNIPTGEVWNPSHWDAVTIMSQSVNSGQINQPNGVAGLDENGAVPIEQGGTGETTPQAALAALGAGVRPNLLDNAIFVGGGTAGNLPVNQIGETTYTYEFPGYVFDRWKIRDDQTIIEFEDDCIVVKNGKSFDGAVIAFGQTLEKSLSNIDSDITISCFVKEMQGDWYIACNSINSSDTKLTIGITEKYFPIETVNQDGKELYLFKNSQGENDYIKIKAIKIEQGKNQSLAYADENNIYLLPQPESDYTTQLAQCRMYFIRCNNAASIAGVAYSQTEFVFTVPITEMRTVPAISNVSCNGIVTKSGIIIPASALSFSALRIGASGCVIRIDSTQNAEVGPAVLLDFSADFTAEL